MTARELFQRHSRDAGLFAIPMAPLAAAYLAETLDLDPEGWKRILVAVGVLVWPFFGAGIWWQRRVASSFFDWLDGKSTKPVEAVLIEAIRAPFQIMLSGFATWVAGGALIVAVGLAGVSGFGGLEAFATLACAGGAGMLSGFFSYANWKRLTRADMRRLVEEAGAEARERNVMRVSLLVKLQAAFLATGMMPLLLAVFLVQSHTAALLAPLLGVAAVSATFSFVLAWAIAREMTETMKLLSDSLTRAANGDLREPSWIETDDEIGRVARAGDRLISELRDALVGLTATTDAVDRAAEGLEEVAGDVIGHAGATRRDTARAVEAMGDIDTQGRGIAAQADGLMSSVHESVSSVGELTATGAEVHELAARVADEMNTSVSALQQIAASSSRIAGAADELTSSAQAASNATTQLEASVSGIDERARAAQEMAAAVAELSDRGRAAVSSVGQGVRQIDRSVAENDRVAASLRERVDDIGAVITVIDEVANTTQLLSLNAAIIAAQAGEDGKAFGVVAGEVKLLASRVSDQTREVEKIIAAISSAAVEAATSSEANRRAVAEGMRRAQEAEKALDEISEAAASSGDHAGAIEEVLSEHSQGARHLLSLVGAVADEAGRIAENASEQLASQAEALSAAEAVREAAQSVHRSAEEQSRSLTFLREGADSVERSCEEIQGALVSQAAISHQSVTLLADVSGRADQSTSAMDEFARAIADLRDRSAAMRGLIARFKT